MQGFEDIVIQLLLRHNCVVVPGFGGFVAKQVFKCRQSAFAGVVALNGLAKLHLVAKQHNVVGALAHGNGVGGGHLACFVNEQVIEAVR